jgi:hypothetical protein
MTTRIWCLFSIANNYDQPEDNLEGWWVTKPSLDQLRKAIISGGDMCEDKYLINVLAGHNTRVTESAFKHGGTTYRLELTDESE